jgi:hypothetical protein
MDAIRIRVSRVMDFGTVVSIVGVDTTSDLPVVVHVDHRPYQVIWDAWKAAGFPQPIEFDADNLTLNLAIDPDDDEPEPKGSGDAVAA